MRCRIDYVYYAPDDGQQYVIGGRYTIAVGGDRHAPGLIENLPRGDYRILRCDRIDHDGNPLIRVSLQQVR